MSTPTPLLRSLLVRRITVVVALCIVSIGAALLIISFANERERLLDRIAAGASRLLPAMGHAEGAPLGLRNLIADPGDPYPLIAYQVEIGDTVVAGDGPTVPARTGPWQAGRERVARGGHLVLRALVNRAGQPARVTMVLDIRRLDDELRAYVLRFVAMFLIIGGIVTAGTIIALGRLVVEPLLALRHLLHTGGERGVAQAMAPESALDRADEIGDVYREFSALRGRLLDADAQRRETTERFRQFADLGADCFWEIDRRGRVTFIAGDVPRLLGSTPGSITGRSLRQLLRGAGVPLGDARALVRELRTHGQWEGDMAPERDDGHDLTLRVHARAVVDAGGAFAGARGIVRDVTTASRAARELAHLAAHDPLTGLLNRRAFDERVAHALEQRAVRDVAATLCLLDLDGFKAVNDHCGHSAGDTLLQQIADLLRRQVRQGDVVARIGGDEFALLLNGCRLSQGVRIAENVRRTVDRFRFHWAGQNHTVGVSIGVAAVEATFSSAGDILRAADACCFRAKRMGRNQVQTYDPSEGAQTERQNAEQWVSRINEAIEGGDFVLHCQPVHALTAKGDRATGGPARYVEILLRMRTSDGRLLAPGAFLPAAERYRLIDRIDGFVLETVWQWLARHMDHIDARTTIAVNLSGVSVADAAFQQTVLERLARAPFDPARLCFEITETTAVQNIAGTVPFLARVRELGCKVALDDFGTGFSSLEHLKHLPIDYLKIDGAFTRDIARNPLDRSLVQCVAEISRLLGITTIAELVGDARTAIALFEAGIDLGQGYWFAAPEPIDTLLEARDELTTPAPG